MLKKEENKMEETMGTTQDRLNFKQKYSSDSDNEKYKSWKVKEIWW